MLFKINNLNDVELFMKQLIKEGVNAHPDDDFSQYVNIDTGEDTFTADDADIRNKMMKECFEVCDNENVDIYNLMQEIFLKETGMDKFIPLPSTIDLSDK
ncbi:hypothetical protein [Mucilaginibacter sp.]